MNPISIMRRPSNKLELLFYGAGALGYGAWKLWQKFGQKSKEEAMKKNSQNPTTSSMDEPYPFGSMSGIGADKIALKSVAIRGEVDGLLFSSIIVQEYRNESSDPAEIIYTFPVGWGTALLGLKATIGEKQLTGKVVEKKEAEKQYEEAVSAGDSAIMVQQSGTGLYTANLGNIKAGETVTVEIHCARLLRFEQGLVRLCIPTVIGQRYGNQYGPGGLAPHESARVDVNVSYPFTLELNLKGEAAKGDITCPTHKAAISRNFDSTTIRLDTGAVLDRDFILLIKGISGNSHALCIEDDNAWMVAASFCPEIPQEKSSPLGLKILVDCSGSMHGSSIAEAQKGLGQVLLQLQPEDYISYSRFGSDVKHLTRKLMPCSPENVVKFLKTIEETEADMGGTEMEGALKSTFMDISQPENDTVPPMVLLITDGDVWQAKEILKTAKESGHRIFAIGMGHAPAECLLREIAEQTGGACEFVSPNENVAETIVRMFHRMRGAIAKNINIQWESEPVWQSQSPRFIYDDETIHSFAILNSKPTHGPVLTWQAGGRDYKAEADCIEATDNRDLLLLGEIRRMAETGSREEKLNLALKYQLVNDLTSLILVYERADGDKIEGLPKIQQVPQMPAYGHGSFMGAGFVADGIVSCQYLVDPFLSRCRSHPLWAGKQKQLKAVIEVPAKRIYEIWQAGIYQNRSLAEFATGIGTNPDFARIAEAIGEIAQRLGVAEDIVWAKFVVKIEEMLAGNPNFAPDRHSRRLLDAALKNISTMDMEIVETALDETFVQEAERIDRYTGRK